MAEDFVFLDEISVNLAMFLFQARAQRGHQAYAQQHNDQSMLQKT